MGPLHLGIRLAAVAGAGFLAMRTAAANQQKESLGSVLYKDYLLLMGGRAETQPDVEAGYADSTTTYELPPLASSLFGITTYDGLSDTIIAGHERTHPDYTIFYLHGGGYWSDPALLYYPFFNRIARAFNAHIVMPVYPKAPTHSAPEMHDMVFARYQYLINERGIDPQSIVVMGDSAGGGLALSLLQMLRDRNAPMPKAGLLISPWLDISNSNDEMDAIQPSDPMLNREFLRIQGTYVAGERDTKDPLVSPIYGDLSGLAPITVVSATHDILHADVRRLGTLAKEQELPITVHTFPGLFHCFPCVPIPESDQALGIFLAAVRA
ncbi:alpha/beta hydrolase [Stomatohabitans albus]|uniref:alpha/beta hydrolase n=1 Tax=Stomatohabitans albus TaxID=3110766 RepID=UPI00300D12DA